MGRAGARDHRGARGNAEPHRQVAFASGVRDLAAQAGVLARLRGPVVARCARRRAGHRARRGRRGRRAVRLDGRLRRRPRAGRRRAADRLALHARHPAGQRPGRRVRHRARTTPPTWATRTRSSTTSSSSTGALDGEPRVVVVVDDLDRCSDESIMETLQAINLVLGASDFFVVLAIDTDMIHRAIARQRGLERGRRDRGGLRGELPPQDHPAAAACCRAARPISASASSASSSARARSASSPAARMRRTSEGAEARAGRRGDAGVLLRPRADRRRRASRSCARCRTPRRSSRRSMRRATC